MMEFLKLMRAAYKLQHVFFTVIDNKTNLYENGYGTYPEPWKKFYIENSLHKFDPIMKHAGDNTPVLWEMLGSLNESERAVMEARTAHGIGPHGMTIPLVGSDGRLSTLSLTGTADTSEVWMKRAMVLFKEFRDIGMIMHTAHMHHAGQAPPAVELSGRHIDCLRMIGHGMNVEEIAQFQGLSQRSTKNYITELKKRLRARNNAQALYNAIQLGFIEI